VLDITDGHALDPVVEVTQIEYTTLCAFTESDFLALIVVFGNGASQILSNTMFVVR